MMKSITNQKHPPKAEAAEGQVFLSSWWFQPIGKILVKMDNLPQKSGENKKCLSCHHLVVEKITNLDFQITHLDGEPRPRMQKELQSCTLGPCGEKDDFNGSKKTS